MAPRRRRRRTTPREDLGVALRDRTAVQPNERLEVGVVVLEGTDGRRAEHYRSYRQDPLALMESRGHVDEAQFRAGREWQLHWERLEIGGAKAIDYGRDVVDGGKLHEPFGDMQVRAAAALGRMNAAVRREMGMLGERVVRLVLAEGMAVKDVITLFGFDPSDTQTRLFYGRVFRDALEILAVECGYAAKKRLD